MVNTILFVGMEIQTWLKPTNQSNTVLVGCLRILGPHFWWLSPIFSAYLAMFVDLLMNTNLIVFFCGNCSNASSASEFPCIASEVGLHIPRSPERQLVWRFNGLRIRLIDPLKNMRRKKDNLFDEDRASEWERVGCGPPYFLTLSACAWTSSAWPWRFMQETFPKGIKRNHENLLPLHRKIMENCCQSQAVSCPRTTIFHGRFHSKLGQPGCSFGDIHLAGRNKPHFVAAWSSRMASPNHAK